MGCLISTLQVHSKHYSHLIAYDAGWLLFLVFPFVFVYSFWRACSFICTCITKLIAILQYSRDMFTKLHLLYMHVQLKIRNMLMDCNEDRSRKKWFSCGWIQANYIQFVIKNMCCFFWQINWWSLPELAVLIHNLYSIKDGTEYKIPVQYDRSL